MLHDANKFSDLKLILAIGHKIKFADLPDGGKADRAVLYQLHNLMYRHHYAWDEAPYEAFWEAAYDKIISTRYRGTYIEPATFNQIRRIIETSGPGSSRPWWHTNEQYYMLIRALENVRNNEVEITVTRGINGFEFMRDLRDEEVLKQITSQIYSWGVRPPPR